MPGGETASYTGTSMAAPHVAGRGGALFKQTYGDAPSATVSQWLLANATPNAIVDGATERHPEPAAEHRWAVSR